MQLDSPRRQGLAATLTDYALAGSYGWERLLEFSMIVPCARFLPCAYTDFSSILHPLRKTRRWIVMEGEAPQHRCARIARPLPPRLPSPRFPAPSPPPPGYPSCWNPHLSTLTGFLGFFDVGAETQLPGRALPRCQGPVTVCGCESIRRTRSHARCITERVQGSPPFCCHWAGSCMCKAELCPQASHVRTRFRSRVLCGGGPHQVPGLELTAPE